MPTLDPDTTSPIFTQALDAVRPRLAAMSPTELLTVQLDVTSAGVSVLGALPKLLPFRPAIVARFGEAAAAKLDELDVTARAAIRAHAEHLVFLTGKNLEPLSALVVDVRRQLLVDAKSLVQRKLLDPGLLGQLRGTASYKDQCTDALQLVAAFRQDWPRIEGKTPVTAETLARAETHANTFATAIGVREQAEAGTSPSADLRRRAYTHFVRTYEEVRRMMSYLRWYEDDASSFAPSLWAGRSSRQGDGEAPAPAATDGAPAPLTPAAS